MDAGTKEQIRDTIKPVISRQVALVAIMMVLLTVTVSARGFSAWFTEWPSADVDYRTETGGQGVGLVNSFAGSDVSMGIGVEVYSFDQNFAGTGYDAFLIRVLGAANTRVAHRTYAITYENNWGSTSTGSSGINGDDVGRWFYFGDMFTFYHYGRAYQSIYVCSNGWAAFVYSGGDGSFCPYVPDPLPTRDTPAVNGPDGVLAPLWRDLNPATGGTIKVYKSGTVFGVVWENVPNYGSSAVNNFNLVINSDGEVRFGYGSVSTGPTTRVGMEDPTGIYGLEFSLGAALGSHGVTMKDPNYRSFYLSDTKIFVNKQTTSDTSSLDFQQGLLAGYNIQTDNPQPDGLYKVAASVGEVFVVAALCGTLGLGGLGCLALETGVALTGALAEELSSPSPPTYQEDAMLSYEQTGFLEVPVRDERWYCGDFGYRNCDTDVSVFDVLIWNVPRDGKLHRLEIQFGVRMGSTAGYLNIWRWAGVVIGVGPNGSLFKDDFEKNGWNAGTDPAQVNWLYWTTDGLWHMTGRRGHSVNNAVSLHSLWYGKESSGNYDTGGRNSGSATSPLVNLRTDWNVLIFWSWFDTERGTTWDKKLVQISTDQGKTWTTLYTISDATDTPKVWVNHVIKLDTYVARYAAIRFFFDSVDGISNSGEGWYIDDVCVGTKMLCGGGK